MHSVGSCTCAVYDESGECDGKDHEFACTVIREDIRRMDELKDLKTWYSIGQSYRDRRRSRDCQYYPWTDQAIAGTENIKVLLETMSGKGTEIGYRFERIKADQTSVQHPERIGICWILVTCSRRDMILIHDPGQRGTG